MKDTNGEPSWRRAADIPAMWEIIDAGLNPLDCGSSGPLLGRTWAATGVKT